MADSDVASPGSPENILQTLALTAVILGSISGNACVMAVVIRSSRLRESPATFLVFSLAIVDGIFMPIGMAYVLKTLNSESTSSMACIFFTTYITMLVYVSILHLSLLSLDRYIAVVFPLRYEAILTKRKIAGLITVAWCPPILSLMVVSFIIGGDELKFRAGLLKCNTVSNASHTVHASPAISPLHQVHLFANNILMGILPLLAIVILNGKVAFIAYKQAKRIQPLVQLTVSERQKKEKRMREVKWAKIMGIVIGAFIVTFIPTFACVAIEAKVGPGTVPPAVVSLLLILTFFNSALNVVVYSIRSQIYRGEIKRLMRDLKNKISFQDG